MRNLNIPAVLVHTVKNKKYHLNGTILSINESNDTCTMRFKNNIIEHNIPMSTILVNEGFLDKIKEYGKKLSDFFIRKVKGFFVLVDEVTNKVKEWSLFNIANTFKNYLNGNTPLGFKFAPSASLAKFVGASNPPTLDDILAEAEEKESNEANTFIRRIMYRYGTTDESLQESVKYVKKKYYKTYKSLNESAVVSFRNLKFGEHSSLIYGPSVNASELKKLLYKNFLNLTDGKPGKHSAENPILVWGAPGIGKTAIIKLVLKKLNERGAANFNYIYISLATAASDTFTLPEQASRKYQISSEHDSTINEVDVKTFTNNPAGWLPVYQDSGDIRENEKRDLFFNSCAFLANNKEGKLYDEYGSEIHYDGGIVFFDEIARVIPEVTKVLMPLLGDKKFGEGYNLASKWGFVLAANRSFDDNEADVETPNYYPTAALAGRWDAVTYVPIKSEWIEWAREINPATGRANVVPFMVDFIEVSPEHVWYATIGNGGWDDVLDKDEIIRMKSMHKGAGDDDSVLSTMQDYLGLLRFKQTRVITPRAWADKISPAFRKELIRLFDLGNKDGLSGEEYYDKLVKSCKTVKTDKNGNKYLDYYGDIDRSHLVDALNDLDDAMWNLWVEDSFDERKFEAAKKTKDFTGKEGRYNIFMWWWINDVARRIGNTDGSNVDDSNPNDYYVNDPENTNTPFMKAWRGFNSYAKQFTPELIKHIWETGKMLPEMQKDDDIKKPQNEYIHTQYSKWKSSTPLIQEVLDKIQQNYPGDIDEDINNMVSEMAKPKLSYDQAKAEAEKLNKEYSIKLGNKNVEFLFAKSDFDIPELLINKVSYYKNIKFIKRLMNFVYFVTKIALLVDNNKFISDINAKLIDKIKNEMDSEDYNMIVNSEALTKALRKYVDDRNKNGKGDPALYKLFLLENAKNVLGIAWDFMLRAKKHGTEQFRQK